MYVNHGSGQENIVFLGLSPYDNNNQINNYKQQFNVGFPCAGTEGGAIDAIAKVIEGQVFYGYPAYGVICPDKKLTFNVCFPPSENCFDPYFENCASSMAVDELANAKTIDVVPNPSDGLITVAAELSGMTIIKIYSLEGNLVFEENHFVEAKLTKGFDLRFLDRGIYFIKTMNQREVLTHKLVIE